MCSPGVSFTVSTAFRMGAVADFCYRPVITDPSSGNKRCVYCDEQNPSDEHAETHNYRQCEEKGFDARTFYRKDHLRQHMRLMHNCEMTPFMDNWKSIAININSRCGFCAKRFTVWQERVDHLTAHFKAGARMSEWKGCRGLDPAVAAQVTNAMPPYLIGIESVSPNPFSASNKGTWRQTMASDPATNAPELGNICDGYFHGDQTEVETTGLPEKATCWEILTIRLGKYANDMAAKGIIVTDEMLQSAARRILYDSDDPWNQTAADNPEWLDLFKKAHGLDFIPNAIGGQGDKVPEDLETYGDLGLRVPFAVQLDAYNQNQAETELCHCGQLPGQHLKCHHAQKMAKLSQIYMTLSKEGVLHDANGKCKHTECNDNLFDASAVDGCGAAGPRHYRWCTYELPPQKAKEIASLTAPLSISTVHSSPKTENTLDHSRRSSNISQGLKSLYDMETQLSLHHGGCTWEDHDSRIAQARAKAQGLSSLSRPECPQGECVEPGVTKKSYLQRHRYELPKHRAQQFATITGAWEDSGLMPEPVTTSIGHMDPQSTTTGAMMEFLGGDVGHDLPFITDAQTSTIPLETDFNWAIPASTDDEAAMINDVDRLIAETTAAQAQQSITADTTSAMFPSATMPNDLMMEDINFDIDMDFEGVFDMPMDETFGYMAGT